MDVSMKINHLENLLVRQPDLRACQPAIQQAYELLRDTYRRDGKVLVCGNGGSAADSEHIVGELMKGFMARRPVSGRLREQLAQLFPADGAYLADHLQGALPAISLVSQSALISAFANDIAPDMVFAQQVYGYGRPGDTLVAISTSGNASNVLHAVQVAKAIGMRTVGLTGETGGKLKGVCDVTVNAPARETYAAQEYHLSIYHALCAQLEQEFFEG